MPLGSFGGMPFVAGKNQVRTWEEFRRRRKAHFAEHKIIDAKAHLQLLSIGLAEMELAVKLVATLGVRPAEDAEAIYTMQETGQAFRMVMGGKDMGKWVIVDFEEGRRFYTPEGKPVVVEVKLKLKEYAARQKLKKEIYKPPSWANVEII